MNTGIKVGLLGIAAFLGYKMLKSKEQETVVIPSSQFTPVPDKEQFTGTFENQITI